MAIINLHPKGAFLFNETIAFYTKSFSSLITESDDFFFFLKDDGTNLWKAIRKDDVLGFERIVGRSRLGIWGQDLIQSLRNQIESVYKK